MSASWHGQEGAVHTTAREVGGKCVCLCKWGGGCYLAGLDIFSGRSKRACQQTRSRKGELSLEAIRCYLRMNKSSPASQSARHPAWVHWPIQRAPTTLRQRLQHHPLSTDQCCKLMDIWAKKNYSALVLYFHLYCQLYCAVEVCSKWRTIMLLTGQLTLWSWQ